MRWGLHRQRAFGRSRTRGRDRKRSTAAVIGAALIVFAAAGAVAQSPHPSAPPAPILYDVDHLGGYAAQVRWRFVHRDGNRTWVCDSAGSAVFLGGNRFLTAAHVVDQNPFTDDCAKFGIAELVVRFGAAELHGRLVGATRWTDEGGLSYAGGADLALIEVDARMIPVEVRQAAPLAFCPSDLSPGAAVRVATQYGVYATTTAPRVNDEFARIDLASRHGFSGAGVFDPTRRCLIGILSSGDINGANYVANDVTRRFLDKPPPAPGWAGRAVQ